MAQCTAKAKSTGQRCTRPAMIGTTVCLQHGGRAALANRGIGSSRFKHGRKSKYLPTALAERAATALADEELLDLRENIAILDAKIADALEHLDDGAAPGNWTVAQRAMARLRTATRADDGTSIRRAQVELEEILERGAAEVRAWDEVRGLIQEQRKLIESERRRLVEMQQVITAEEAFAMIASIAASIREHVTEPETLRAIQGDLSRFAGRAQVVVPRPPVRADDRRSEP